jgi:multidrug efflux pump subunit AcrB
MLISAQADTDVKDEAADMQTRRGIATQAINALQQSPGIAVMRDDGSPDSPQVKIQIDPDRANVLGITNADVANWRQIGARTARAQNRVTKISLDHQILLTERQRSPYGSSV